MEYLKALLLGVVEGLTEFLPVSSTGHLIVVSRLINFVDTDGTFEIVIQLGAIMAVVWFYRQDLWGRVVRLRRDGRLPLVLLVGFLPAAIVGFLFGDTIKNNLFRPITVAIALIVGGLILYLVDTNLAPRPETSLDQITFRQGLLIGLGQLFAYIPGVSRSAATIIGGMSTGLDRRTATEFSFYLAIPTLGGATLYDYFKNYDAIAASNQLGLFAVGTATAFLVALAAIGWLLKYVSHHDFRKFAIYRVMVGLLILGLIAGNVL